MTTRKPATRLPLLTLFFASLIALAGCATPGPNRGYYIADTDLSNIVQFDPAAPDQPTSQQQSFIGWFDDLYGLAYDPFTDHFFIRLNPGSRFLVVDRPGRLIKRRFWIEGKVDLPAGAGDIAIRSRDRHLFITTPAKPELIEINLNGNYVRTITLAGLDGQPDGVAYDQADNRLLTLTGDRIDTRDLDGQILASTTLDHPITPRGLAFDSAARELFVPLAPPLAGLGVFSTEGHLLRTLPLPADAATLAFDVGPHSLLRLF